MTQNMSQIIGRRQLFALAGMGAAAMAMPASLRAMVNDRYPTLNGKIQEYLSRRKAAGIVMAIGKGQASPDYLKGGTLAFKSKTVADENSLFRIYSMTKPITGMAAMMLVEEGKVTLDQPIADFLPEYKTMRVLTDPDNSIDSVPAKTQITLRHLLTHTSGLGYGFLSKGPIKAAYGKAQINPGVVTKLPIPGFGGLDNAPSLKEFAERLATLPLFTEPGTKWRYSVSLDLVGRLVELISGVPFDSFLQQRIFDPLKMHSTFFQVPESELPRFTTNYGVMGGSLLPLDPAEQSIYLDKPAFPFGGAGLVSSAADYDRFLACLLGYGAYNGVRLISEETAKLAMSNLVPTGVDTTNTMIKGAGFGAGARVGISGVQEGSFGWGGAAGTTAFISTKFGVRAIGMIQYMPTESQDFQNKFYEWVAADLTHMTAGA